jgi:hypothetical protein
VGLLDSQHILYSSCACACAYFITLLNSCNNLSVSYCKVLECHSKQDFQNLCIYKFVLKKYIYYQVHVEMLDNGRSFSSKIIYRYVLHVET